jgi:Na+/pantothenate symporter
LTDALQMVIMLSGILVVLIHGVYNSSGVAKILETNRETGRLNLTYATYKFNELMKNHSVSFLRSARIIKMFDLYLGSIQIPQYVIHFGV